MPRSDADLVLDTRRGGREAFEALVRRHLRPAYAVALARLGDPHDAEDVCQDAFVVALERLDDLREPDRFGAWLCEIVRNRASNRRRGNRVREAEPLDEALQRSGGDDPARALERTELRSDLLAALGTLTETQREVVLLHDWEGWRHAEIGERLGLAAGTVRYHLHHARRALRERLAPRHQEEFG